MLLDCLLNSLVLEICLHGCRSLQDNEAKGKWRGDRRYITWLKLGLTIWGSPERTWAKLTKFIKCGEALMSKPVHAEGIGHQRPYPQHHLRCLKSQFRYAIYFSNGSDLNWPTLMGLVAIHGVLDYIRCDQGSTVVFSGSLHLRSPILFMAMSSPTNNFRVWLLTWNCLCRPFSFL